MDKQEVTGVPASPSRCQPSASAAKASSQSGIPNAVPQSVRYSLKYDDGGSRLAVSYDADNVHWPDTVIIRCNESSDFEALVDLADVSWLIAALRDVLTLADAQRDSDGSPEGRDACGSTGTATARACKASPDPNPGSSIPPPNKGDTHAK